MAWIQIPEGKTEVEIPNAGWVKIPEGKTEMEIPDNMLGTKSKAIEPTIKEPSIQQVTNDSLNNRSPFMQGLDALGVTGEDSLVSNIADSQIGQGFSRGVDRTIESAPKVAQDVGAGLVYGTASTTDMLHTGLDTINPFMSEQEADSRQTLRNKQTEQLKNLANNPESAEFGTGTFLSPVPEVAIIGKLASKASKVASAVDSGISSTVKAFAKRKGVSNEELLKVLSNVPKEKHAEAIANHVKSGGTGVIKEALRGSDDRITEFLRQSQLRTQGIENVAGTNKADDIASVASKNFGDMVDEVRNMDIVVDSKGILKGIDTTKILGGKDAPAKAVLDSMDEIFKANPNQNLSDLLLMREEINTMINTAKGTSRNMLGKAKANLDNIISKGTPNQIDDLIKTTISDYASAKQNLKMKDLIDKSKNADGVINYNKLAKQISKDSNINTYQSKAVVNILEEFDKKFSNDYRVLGGTKGSNTKEGLLGLKSEILSPLKALIIRWGEYGNNVAMQKLIEKSLDSSKTPLEFASKIKGDKRVPSEIRKFFGQKLNEAKKAKRNTLKAQEDIEKVENLSGLGLSPTKRSKPKTPKPTRRLEDLLTGKQEVDELTSKPFTMGVQPQGQYSGSRGQNISLSETLSPTPAPKPFTMEVQPNGQYLGVQPNGQYSGRRGQNIGLSEALNPTPTPKPVAGQDTTGGMLGMKYGNKATRAKMGDIANEKAILKRFMDDLANPKVIVDKKKASELYDMLKADSTTMYASTQAKEDAWNNAMDIVNHVRTQASVSPKVREQMMNAIKKYYDLLGDTI